MNEPPAQHELHRWLALATKGLPDEAQQRVCEEIEDHYWSSASHYQEKGESAAEAHRAAIAELGDVHEARCAFLDAHASRRRYLLVGLLSMAMPLLFAAVFLREPEQLVNGQSLSAMAAGMSYLMQPLLLVLPVTAIIYSGCTLLNYRFRFPIGKWRAGLLVAGVLITFLPSSIDGISLIAVGKPFFAEAGVKGIAALRGLMSDSGVLLLSVGLVSVSHHISRLKHSLYGMKFLLIASSLAWGFSQVGLVFVGTENTISPLVFVLMFTATAFCVFLGWMFIKAAFMGRLVSIPHMGRTGTAA